MAPFNDYVKAGGKPLQFRQEQMQPVVFWLHKTATDTKQLLMLSGDAKNREMTRDYVKCVFYKYCLKKVYFSGKLWVWSNHSNSYEELCSEDTYTSYQDALPLSLKKILVNNYIHFYYLYPFPSKHNLLIQFFKYERS